jgi:beta-galactosidase
LVIAPALTILDVKRVESLEQFVNRGGHLVLTPRTGMKDRANALLSVRQPGGLAAIAGVEVEEYYPLDENVPVIGNIIGQGKAYPWAERLRILDEKNTIVAARYGESNGWLEERPAITVHSQGNGLVYMLAASLDDRSQETFIKHVVNMAGLYPLDTPPGVEICTRARTDGQSVYLIINHKKHEQRITLPWPAYDHLSQSKSGKELLLPGYGVLIVTRDDG